MYLLTTDIRSLVMQVGQHSGYLTFEYVVSAEHAGGMLTQSVPYSKRLGGVTHPAAFYAA